MRVVVVVTLGDTFLTEREILRLATLAQYDSTRVLHSYGEDLPKFIKLRITYYRALA